MHINEFQEMMKKLYFPRDVARGARGNYEWLVDEVFLLYLPTAERGGK